MIHPNLRCGCPGLAGFTMMMMMMTTMIVCIGFGLSRGAFVGRRISRGQVVGLSLGLGLGL